MSCRYTNGHLPHDILTLIVREHFEEAMRFARRSVSDADIRRYAIETLPILKQHLALAQAVQNSLERTDKPSEATSGSQTGSLPALGQAPSR